MNPRWPSNEQHLKRAIDAVLDLQAQRIGVIGLAFKENTDDLRESPVVTLLEQLIGKGREVRVFDPHIRLDAIYGSNRNFILESIPHIGRLLAASLDQVLGWADHLVLAQKQSAETMQAIRASGLPVHGAGERAAASRPRFKAACNRNGRRKLSSPESPARTVHSWQSFCWRKVTRFTASCGAPPRSIPSGWIRSMPIRMSKARVCICTMAT